MVLLCKIRFLLRNNKMRTIFVLLHRWAGLFIAAFLILSGVTGAVISWDHELDEWLNADLTKTQSVGTALPTLDLIQAVEARHPTVQITFAPLRAEPGHALSLFVMPRINPDTGELYKVEFNQIFVDPVSGMELGKREWGAVWPITRRNLVSFLYVLHYSLHMPEFLGIDRWGVWLMGIVALIWTIDCFSGLYLTLPSRRRSRSRVLKNNAGRLAAPDITSDVGPDLKSRSWLQRWLPAWKIRWHGNRYKLNFDLHRALSLWTWILLFVVAFTAFSLNLYREIFFPVMSLVSDVTPSAFDTREPRPETDPVIPQQDFATAISSASRIAYAKGWEDPAGSIFYSPDFGIYGVAFFQPEDGHGAGGAGHRTIHLDAVDGRELGAYEPWQGTIADLFVQAQFPIHSGRILGLPGRILISIMGIVIALLSVTGVVIWWRKRGARNSKST
jgi:uncharacterized iron-regulated membrane protein